MFNAFEFSYAVHPNNYYTFLLKKICPYFVIITSFIIPFFHSFYFHPMDYSTPSFLNVTVLYYNCFTKDI